MMAGFGILAFSDESFTPAPLGRIVYDGMNITYIDPDGSENTPALTKNNTGLSKSSLPKLKSRSFPSYYDLRGVDGEKYITDPEIQGFGDCWTYATMSSLESNVMKRGYGERHFSKSHLGYFAYTPLNEGLRYSDPFNLGGNYLMSVATLANLEGIAPLSDYPNAEGENPPVYGESDRFNHSTGFILDDAVLLKSVSEIKSWIMENGAVYVGIDSTDAEHAFSGKYNAFMVYGKGEESDHAVTIVGWCDDIPSTDFPSVDGYPQCDGAWIIKNSWVGDGYDYMFLSYDQYLVTPVGFTAQPDTGLYNHYTYSERDASGYFLSDRVEYGNVYTAEENEDISQVGFMIDTKNALTDVTVTFKVYKNLPSNYSSPAEGTLAGTYSAHYTNDGYYTFELPQKVSVGANEKFSVIITMSDSAGCDIKQLIELDAPGVYKGALKQCYYKNGTQFRDLYADYGSQGAGSSYMHVYTSCHHSEGTRDEENRSVIYCTQCGQILGYRCITHTPGEVYYISEPSCTRSGRAVYTCTYCEEQYTVDIPAYGHSFYLTECESRNSNELIYENICSRCGYVQHVDTQIKGTNVITLGELLRMIFERIFAIFRR